MTIKVTPQHLSKTASVYIRQSSMGQVRHHRESTERQYALKNEAIKLGWNENQIQVLDGDLGQSGTSTKDRHDFKKLVTEVCLGRVGAVFAIEASRLARSNADWHRLIEICGSLSTEGLRVRRCPDVRRKRAAVSPTQLRRSMERRAAMGTLDGQSRFGDPQESVLRGRVCVWPVSLCEGHPGEW